MRLFYVAAIAVALLPSTIFAIRKAESVNARLCPQLLLASYFGSSAASTVLPKEAVGQCPVSDFSYACGVVPRGQATFILEGVSRENQPVSMRDLKFVVDAERMAIGQPFIGIQWRSHVFFLEAPADLYLPLLRFIHRDSFIAYTIPVVDFDHVYFRDNSLVAVPRTSGFIAKEFLFTRFESLLLKIDLQTDAEALLDQNLKQQILRNINPRPQALDRKGTYVNADFHVTYQVFLNPSNPNRSIDVAGLPLRYHWNVATDGSGIVRDVEVFSFPEPSGLQYDAVIFFQIAAILRQLKSDNPAEFEKLLSTVEAF